MGLLMKQGYGTWLLGALFLSTLLLCRADVHYYEFFVSVCVLILSMHQLQAYYIYIELEDFISYIDPFHFFIFLKYLKILYFFECFIIFIFYASNFLIYFLILKS